MLGSSCLTDHEGDHTQLTEYSGVLAAVPIYVQHYLGISASSPASWQQTLAAAMHSRIQAIQQQHLPPVVISSQPGPLPLLPQVSAPCRLSHLSRLTPAGSRHGIDFDSSNARQVIETSSGPGQLQLQASAHQTMSRLQTAEPSHAAQHGSASTSASHAAPSNTSGSGPNHVSYADVLMMKPTAPNFSKRKIPEVSISQEFEMAIKRRQNGFETSLSGLQDQSNELQKILAQSQS